MHSLLGLGKGKELLKVRFISLELLSSTYLMSFPSSPLLSLSYISELRMILLGWKGVGGDGR